MVESLPKHRGRVVCASRLDQAFSEGCLLGSVSRRRLAHPGNPVGEPFFDADDIADVVVAVLTDVGHARRIYEATGPRKRSFAAAVEELAEATGGRIRYMRVSTERYAALLAGPDVPEEVLVRLRRVMDRLVDGRSGAADPGVERAIGAGGGRRTRVPQQPTRRADDRTGDGHMPPPSPPVTG